MGDNLNPLQKLLNWYTLSKRRETTFQKIYEHPYLSKEQIDRLKLSQALFETIPLIVYSPYLFILLRLCGSATNSSGLKRILMIGLPLLPMFEVSSRYMRDIYYWPIVR